MEFLQSPDFWVGLVKIIWINIILSGDNAVVIAVAAAAKGDMVLLILGLAISISLMIFGSTLMIKLMERFPIIVVIGAGLIGWVAGEAIVSDNVFKGFVEANRWLHYAGPALGAAVVIGLGKLVQARASRQPA